jgi:ammonium transporter, Amt family
MGLLNHWSDSARMPWRGLLALLVVCTLAAAPVPRAFAQEAATETAETEAADAAEEAAEDAEAPEEATAEESAAAESEAPTPATPEQESAYMTNSLIMFFCWVLVIAMQAGFALVEVGLNQAKNAVNILFKNLLDFCIGALLYLLIGYGLMYPGSAFEGKWFGFGGMGYGKGLGYDAGTADLVDATASYSPNSDFIFQVAFAATAATIVSGAVAGRMKFSAYLIYSAVITGLVYPISGMWKWGYGVAYKEDFADFAGSIVVHAVGGFAGLAGAIVLGPRIGRYVNGKSMPMPGHNLTFATLGVFILLIGWYGFNPGSVLTYYGTAGINTTVYCAVTTTIAAAVGAVVAMLLSWALWSKPDLTMALNGMLAGLVGITANCDQMSLVNAMIVGGVAGALVVAGIVMLDKLRIDDPVGAFPVHGLCGLWGGIATGILGENIPEGLSRGGYIMLQTKWSLIIAAWAFGAMFALFFLLKLVGMLRVSPEEELEGLDIGEHGLHAYDYVAATH